MINGQWPYATSVPYLLVAHCGPNPKIPRWLFQNYTKSIKRIDHCVSRIMNLLLVNTNRYRYYLQRPAPLLFSNNRINYTMKEHRQIMIHWYVNWPTDKHTDVALRLCCLHSVNISWVVIFGYNFRVYLRAPQKHTERFCSSRDTSFIICPSPNVALFIFC